MDKLAPRQLQGAVPGRYPCSPPHSRLTVLAQQSLLKAAVLEAGGGKPRREGEQPCHQERRQSLAKGTPSNDAIPKPTSSCEFQKPAQTALKMTGCEAWVLASEFTPTLLSFLPGGNLFLLELMSSRGRSHPKSHPNGLENVVKKYISATSPAFLLLMARPYHYNATPETSVLVACVTGHGRWLPGTQLASCIDVCCYLTIMGFSLALSFSLCVL